MALPPLRAKSDIPEFAEHLLSCPQLWNLVAGFGMGAEGLAQRRRDLAAALLDERFDDPSSPADPVAQAGRVLANWTGLDESAPAAPSAQAPVRQRLGWLKQFAAKRWDFRVGRERDFIPVNAELLNPYLADQAYELASEWGMRTPEPARGHFDHVIVLGGLLRANFNRPLAAAEMVQSGSITTASIVGLGAPRRMSEAEMQLGQSLDCAATTEQAALEAGLERAFGFAAGDWRPTDSPNLRQAIAPAEITIRSAGAPLNADGSRANTGGAFGWFMDESELVQPGQSVLSVTTPLYWIAGHLSLVARMPAGATLTTVGADPAHALPGLGQAFMSQHYLQEIKTAIDVLAGSLSN
ncbi:MAG: hypothetical protein ACOYEV_16500 [Candidatus Nanopelagicales bacterium]